MYWLLPCGPFIANLKSSNGSIVKRPRTRTSRPSEDVAATANSCSPAVDSDVFGGWSTIVTSSRAPGASDSVGRRTCTHAAGRSGILRATWSTVLPRLWTVTVAVVAEPGLIGWEGEASETAIVGCPSAPVTTEVEVPSGAVASVSQRASQSPKRMTWLSATAINSVVPTRWLPTKVPVAEPMSWTCSLPSSILRWA